MSSNVIQREQQSAPMATAQSVSTIVAPVQRASMQPQSIAPTQALGSIAPGLRDGSAQSQQGQPQQQGGSVTASAPAQAAVSANALERFKIATNDRSRLLLFATCSGDNENIKRCLNGLNIESKKACINQVYAPLREAICAGKEQCVRLLAAQDEVRNAVYDRGNTPLHTAVRSSNPLLVTTLLEQGADINVQKEQGVTPLMLSIINQDTACMEVLLKNPHVMLDHVDLQLGDTALHGAINISRSAHAKLLIERGASLNIQNKKGRTPLMCAAHAHTVKKDDSGMLGIIALLLQKDADQTLKDNEGKTFADYLSPDLKALRDALKNVSKETTAEKQN
jgi:ankyrin repeat protein